MTRKTIEKIFSIVLFAVAVWMVIYAIWVAYTCAGVVSNARAAEQLDVGVMQFVVVEYYMNSCAQYFAYALLLAAAGLLLQKKQPESNKTDDIICRVPNLAAIDDDDDDDDEDADDEDDTNEPGEWYSVESDPETKQDEDEDAD